MTCRDVEARITAYLDGDLDATTSSALRGHLRGCAACRVLAEDHSRIAGMLAGLPPADPPAAMWEGVMAKVAEAEQADARRSRWAIFGARLWERLRPQLVPALAIGAAATVAAVWLTTRGQGGVDGEPPTRARAPVPGMEIAKEPPIAPAAPVEDIEVVIEREILRIDALYASNVAELLELAGEERATWPAARQRAYDAELARLRSAVAAVPLRSRPSASDGDPFEAAEAAAAARETRERAWQALVAFLQRAATGDLVAEVTP
jgi:hypothetical protein